MNTSGKNKTSKILGVLCLVAGIVCNKFVIEALVSGDGKISALSVNIAIAGLQIAFISAGILYLKQWYTLLPNIGVGLLFLFVLQFWVRVFLEVPVPQERMFKSLPFPPSLFESGFNYRDQISRYEQRFGGIKPLLPPHGVVGYVTSQALPWEEAKMHYGLTGYVLSPRKIDWSTHHELVVGNFPDFENVPPIREIDGFVLVKDFGNGVILLKIED